MQAARGASLNANGDRDEKPSTVRLFAIVAVLWLIIDQVTKVIAVAALDKHEPVTVIPNVFWFTLTRNPGAAFSTGTGFTVILSAIAIVVCIVVIRIAATLRDPGWAIGLGLMLGGALGNLTDRLFREPSPMRGHVVDFLQIPFGYPIFNMADVGLTFAAIIIIWRTWRGVGMDGSR